MGGGAPSPLPNGKTKMTLRNLIPQKPEVKMSSRELTGCNKRPSDRLEASWFPGGFLTGFSGDDLETEARRIGEIKEARFFGKPRCQSGIYLSIHVPPDFECVFPIWSRDLEKSLENEQKKLQEEKKRNEELQKDAKDGVEEPGGPHEADEKAQNCRCCLIAVMAEGKTLCWRMDEIMKLWNILFRHLWWSYKVAQRFIEHLIPSRFWSYFEILDIFGCLFVRMQRWLTLVLLSHGCSSMSRSPSFNTATQMLLRKMRHSWAFSITLRTVWKLWKMKMQNFRLGWRAMKFSNICRFLATCAMWMLLGETRFAGLSVMITFAADTGLNLIATIGGNGWELRQTSNPTKPLKIFEKLRINFASPLLFCYFFVSRAGKSLGGPKGEGRVESPSANLRVAGGFALICDAKGTCFRTRVEPLRQDTKLKELKDLEKESKEQMKHR